MKRRLVLGLLVALCLVPVAGCGGGSSAGEGAAGIVPASVPVYISVDTDFEGDQIAQARELLARFPGSAGALAMLESELEADGDVDFDQDIRPALGPTLDVAVLEVPRNGGEGSAVVLLQPEDPAKLDALLERSPTDSRPVTAEVEGWTVLAEEQAELDSFEAAREGDSLESSDAFDDAMDGLAEDALVRAYVAPEAVREALPTEGMSGLPQLDQLVGLGGLGMAVSAEERGFQLESAAVTEQELEGFEPELPDRLPAGALAYFGFGDLATAGREALNKLGEQNPEFDRQLAQLEFALGLSLDEDLLPLIEQEGAIALYPGAAGSDLPSIVTALKVDDETEALATIDRIFERVTQFAPDITPPTRSEVGGVEVREVSLPQGSAFYGGADGMIFATNDSDLITQLTGDGETLADDPVFGEARELADVPDEVESLAYVNFDDGIGYALSLAEDSGQSIPPQVSENLEPLSSFVLYSTRDGDRSRGTGFLALDE